MKRRQFISLLWGATAAGLPLAARAQQPKPVIGFLGSTSPGPWAHFVAAFRAGLKETGYVDGQNVTIEFRWAGGQYDRLPALAADLVRRKVAVLISTGGEPTANAAKAATTTIPIVFTIGADPVKLGLVASLNRPGGNLTGVNLFTGSMDDKRLGLLHSMVPSAASIAVLENPKNPNVASRTAIIKEAAHAIGVKVEILQATTRQEIAEAFASLNRMHAGALFVAADPFFNAQREMIVALAAEHAIPAVYEQRVYATAGGLMSYGTDTVDSYRQVGRYAGRILKGEKPADLPVVQSTKFEFVINLKTAKALRLNVPPALSALADEIIE
jgi:putative ABC transport system substrate-binding protein